MLLGFFSSRKRCTDVMNVSSDKLSSITRVDAKAVQHLQANPMSLEGGLRVQNTDAILVCSCF